MVERKPVMATGNPTVLYLSYDGLTDPLGQSQILPYLAGLKDVGITVISFEKSERYSTDKISIEAFCQANNLHWIPMPYHKWPPVLSTLFDLWRLRRKAKALHRES